MKYVLLGRLLPGACTAMLATYSHSFILGVRNSQGLSVLMQTIKDLKERNQFFLVDADGLYITTRDPELIKGYRNVVMTPNKNEYKRLGDQLGIDVEDPDSQKRIVQALGGPTIVRKGARDIIMDPDGGVIEGTDVGCPRRAGGQVRTLVERTHLPPPPPPPQEPGAHHYGPR